MSPKLLVIFVALILIVADITTFVIYVSNVGADKVVPHSVRFVLTVALSASLIRGWVPSRWITIILMILALMLFVRVLPRMVSNGQPIAFPVGVMTAYTACFIALITPFAGRHFQNNLSWDGHDEEGLA